MQICKRVIILKCCENCDGGYKQWRWSGYSKSVSWLNVVLADTVEGVRRLSSNAGRFEGGWECGLAMLALFARWADSVCVVAVSPNTWMLAFSMLNILLTLLSNFSSFSTFWKHALQMLLEDRPSPLLHPTLWKSSLTQTSSTAWIAHGTAAKGHFPTLVLLACHVGTY